MNNSKAVHEKTFSIEWGDMDALGHVNNGRYFDYFQQARIEWLYDAGMAMNAEKGPVVIKIGCTFLKPVVYPATLTLKTYLHSPGRTSIGMDHQLFQKEQLMAEAESKIVWVNYQSGQSIPLPEILRAYF